MDSQLLENIICSAVIEHQGLSTKLTAPELMSWMQAVNVSSNPSQVSPPNDKISSAEIIAALKAMCVACGFITTNVCPFVNSLTVNPNV